MADEQPDPVAVHWATARMLRAWANYLRHFGDAAAKAAAVEAREQLEGLVGHELPGPGRPKPPGRVEDDQVTQADRDGMAAEMLEAAERAERRAMEARRAARTDPPG